MANPFDVAWSVLKNAYHPAIAGLMQRENMREAMGPGHARDDFQDELSASSPFDRKHLERMALDEALGHIRRRSTGLARGPPEPSYADEMGLDAQAQKVEDDPTEGFYHQDPQNPGRTYQGGERHEGRPI